MIEVGEQIIMFQVCYKTIKKSFEQQDDDLYLLKNCASDLLYKTSNFKMNENFTFSRFDQEELVKLLAGIRNLIGVIEKEIEIQNKEEYFNSNNNEI